MSGLGVDIGGTKINVVEFDESGHGTATANIPTAYLRRGTPLFATDLVDYLRSVLPPSCDRVGVSLNGVLDRGTVVYSSLMGGRVDYPLRIVLERELGLPVVVDDDIHAMTIAEARRGHGAGLRAFAMLNLGTGIGVGCYEKEVLRGRYGAGLISEQKIWVPEFAEYVSLDRTVCGRGVKEMHERLGGRAVDAVTVFRWAQEGDERALRVVDTFTRCLAYVLQLVSRFYHPERIVVAGSVSRSAGLYLDNARSLYLDGLHSDYVAEIVVSDLKFAAEIGTLFSGVGPARPWEGAPS